MGLLDFFKSKPATTDELIQAWLSAPTKCIKGQFDKDIEWRTTYGLAPMEGLPDTHGYSQLPDLKITTKVGKTEADIGWIEGISMYSGGTARVKHFALDTTFTGKGYGEVLLKSIIDLLRLNNATSIEFHENHKTKITHYRKFFAKHGIIEHPTGVWKFDLYSQSEVPQQVVDFQTSLLKSNYKKKMKQ